MAAADYKRALEDAKLLTSVEQIRLIEELAVRLTKSGEPLDLSRVDDAVAHVERMRKSDSRHWRGGLKTPQEFLTELESWEG